MAFVRTQLQGQNPLASVPKILALYLPPLTTDANQKRKHPLALDWEQEWACPARQDRGDEDARLRPSVRQLDRALNV